MINFNYETEFALDDENRFTSWVTCMIEKEGYYVSGISYIFCDDDYLITINKQYLNHDTYTDIITFDYTEGLSIGGDIFISLDRVKENAIKFKVDFDTELLRVMAHGVLHLLGYKDKKAQDVILMREKESFMMNLFHVEQ